MVYTRLQVHERVGILLVELYEREGKSVTVVCKKAQKGQEMHFMAVKTSRKRSVFTIVHILKTVNLQRLKGISNS